MAFTWVRRLGGIVVVVFVLAALALAAAVGVVPALTGASTYTVLSGSMRPSLPVGTVVVDRTVPVERIAVGDVITFLAHEPDTTATRIVTHRVVGIDPGPVLHTKGDANATADPGGTVAADVRGQLWYSVPLVGMVSSATWLLLGGGVLLLLLGASVLLPKRPAAPVRPSAPARHRG
jgi:signal peptidase